eukprot:GHVP01017082.1.p1 GENE.GHVP01017082.1~~GHVP01017082.1.p1  ORF type:complete len:118 (-),score=11.31 GHVP01017082.1:835-1188(-)
MGQVTGSDVVFSLGGVSFLRRAQIKEFLETNAPYSIEKYNSLAEFIQTYELHAVAWNWEEIDAVDNLIHFLKVLSFKKVFSWSTSCGFLPGDMDNCSPTFFWSSLYVRTQETSFVGM